MYHFHCFVMWKMKNSVKEFITNSSLVHTESYEMEKCIILCVRLSKDYTKLYFAAISRKWRELQRQIYAFLTSFFETSSKVWVCIWYQNGGHQHLHLTAVYSRKMLNVLHYNQRGKWLLIQKDRPSNAVKILGAQVQATAEKSIFCVSVNFYVLPLGFL